ncbi:hypothetical protein GCM10022258_32180 [Aquimarina gracilis]
MPPRTDGISPQNKIDNNVSTAINMIVIVYLYELSLLKKLKITIKYCPKLQIKIILLKKINKIYDFIRCHF